MGGFFKKRGFNSEVREMNNPWRIPDLVFSFPGIFLDGFWVFPSPTGLADPRYGWIEFFREVLSDESIGVFIESSHEA